ncbi:hypothetical protein [Paenibacillus sp. 1P07SE]|uniref:hypothetical protein n=1 Tax=Paenibacillus sp. 1P07SE TaxID=3132209 RepID=UPI0039A6BAA3
MRRGHIAALVLLTMLPLLMVVRPSPAQACDCGPPPEVQTALEQASAVFTGTVLDIAKQPTRDYGYDAVILEVDRAWKGVETTQVIVYTGWSSCMFPFEEERTYLLYTELSGEDQMVIACGRSAAADSPRAMEDIALLGEGKVPTVEVDLQSRFSEWQPVIVWGTAVGGLLLVALGVLMILRRLRRSS